MVSKELLKWRRKEKKKKREKNDDNDGGKDGTKNRRNKKKIRMEGEGKRQRNIVIKKVKIDMEIGLKIR